MVVTVEKEHPPCEIPSDPEAVTLGAKPSGTAGQMLVSTEALRALAVYLVKSRAVTKAQDDCIRARQAQ